MEQILPLLLSGAGGAVFGPIISKLLGGKGVLGVITGLVGGVGAAFGGEQIPQLAGMLGNLTGEEGGLNIQNILAQIGVGAGGGGILGAITGLIKRN